MEAGADQSPASSGEESALRSGVRHGHKREFDLAVQAQAEISASIGHTRARESPDVFLPRSSPPRRRRAVEKKPGVRPPKVPRFPRPPPSVEDPVASALVMAEVVRTEENLALEGFISVPVAHAGHISTVPMRACSSGVGDASATMGINGPSGTRASSSTTKKLIGDIKELLGTGLSEGLMIKYVAGVREKLELHGWVHGGKILCLCSSCKGSKAIAACEYEKHAGSLKKRPADYVFLGNGRTIRDVLEKCQPATVDAIETTKSLHASPSQSSMATCGPCQSEAAHNSGHWYPNARQDDFDASRCGPCTVLPCDECDREYHLGCLKDHSMINFEGIPKVKWFCTYRYMEVSMSLQRTIHQREMILPDIASSKIMMKNEEIGHLDITWRLLSGSTFADNKLLLDSVISVFHESFNLIVGARGRDLISLMTKGSKGQDHRYRNIYCPVLTVGSSVVSSGTLQILKCEVAQLPLIAANEQNQKKVYFQPFFHCFQSFLVSMCIRHLLLPEAKEAESMWIEKFGFIKRVPVENFMAT